MSASSPPLLDTVNRHGKSRVGQLRDLLARHPDVDVRDVDTAAELILFTVEVNTHKLMADPRDIPKSRRWRTSWSTW